MSTLHKEQGMEFSWVWYKTWLFDKAKDKQMGIATLIGHIFLIKITKWSIKFKNSYNLFHIVSTTT